MIGDWNAKIGSQELPGVTGKFGLGVQNEAGQRLTEFCQENTLVIENTLFQQHKRRLYTWTSPDGQYWNRIDYILCSQRWRSSIQSAKARPGADHGSDDELLTAKFRLKLKKVRKTTRPFRYDLNQIPYDYTVKVKSLSHVWLFVTPWTVAYQARRSLSVHGIFQTRVLEWVAISFFRASNQGSNPGLLHCRQTLYHLSHQGIQ